MIGIVPGSMKLVPGGLAAEANQTMQNIKTSLEAHGASLDDLVKCTVMLADMSEWVHSMRSTEATSRIISPRAVRLGPVASPPVRAWKWNALQQ